MKLQLFEELRAHGRRLGRYRKMPRQRWTRRHHVSVSSLIKPAFLGWKRHRERDLGIDRVHPSGYLHQASKMIG